jgi:hypothetical protein
LKVRRDIVQEKSWRFLARAHFDWVFNTWSVVMPIWKYELKKDGPCVLKRWRCITQSSLQRSLH